MDFLSICYGPDSLPRSLEAITTSMTLLVTQMKADDLPVTGSEVLDIEKKMRHLGARLGDLSILGGLVRAHQDNALVRKASAEARERLRKRGVKGPIKNKGWWPVTVRLPGGLRAKIKTPYLRPSRKGRPGRPRGTGRRGEAGVGCYPVLERLGIVCRATPLTRSIVSRQTVVCSSYREAREQLARDGLTMSISEMVDLATDTGTKALELRNDALAAALAEPLPEKSMVEGQRVRISVDGGRARTRRTNRKARKGKNGRRPFSLKWREPRIITIDVLDREGTMDRRWRPMYEVSLQEADRVFDLPCGMLRLIGAHQAKQIVFVADGAEWIWNRTDELFERAEVPLDKVEFALDYYHATEHVAEAMKACRNLKPSQRDSLVRFLCKEMLEPGGPARVIDKLRAYAKGRRGKAMNKEIEYLVGHLEAGRLNYHQMRMAKLPIGSGVVESAVRRVINLRFKNASQCWEDNRLEALMYLRAILKSGWWDEAMEARLAGRHFLAPACSPNPTSTQEIAHAA